MVWYSAPRCWSARRIEASGDTASQLVGLSCLLVQRVASSIQLTWASGILPKGVGDPQTQAVMELRNKSPDRYRNVIESDYGGPIATWNDMYAMSSRRIKALFSRFGSRFSCGKQQVQNTTVTRVRDTVVGIATECPHELPAGHLECGRSAAIPAGTVFEREGGQQEVRKDGIAPS